MIKNNVQQTPFIRRMEQWKTEDVYSNHRIPGKLVTDRGTLIEY